MQISLNLDRSVPVLSMEGRLDARGALDFEAAWATVPPTAAYVVLDLSKVDYISSMGIGSLLTAERLLRRRHGRTVLAGLTPFAAKVLSTTGIIHEFQRAAQVSEAITLALAGTVAEAASSEHTIDGRLYRILPNSTEPCFLELWGDLEHAPEDLRSAFSILKPPHCGPIDASLDELGFAFGVGGFGNAGSQAADSMGVFVAAEKFAGVLPADGHFIPDFVLSDQPDEVDVVVSGVIGLSGPPTFTADVEASAPISLKQVLQDLTAVLTERDGSAPPAIGFVMQVKRPHGLLLVGLFSPETEELQATGIRYAADPTLTPKLEDLAGVVNTEDAAPVQAGAMAVYLPGKLRLGIEKRLKIQVDGDVAMQEEWRQIIRRLYRDCSRVILTQLTGGYNAKTFRVVSYDNEGRRLLPTVLKIGERKLIRREEEAHRAYVQRFILNNSTTIMGTAIVGEWAALRYNFVGISGPDTRLTWLLEYYQGQPTESVLALFDRLYTQILKPWYGQPRWEPIDLYTDHTPLRLFPDVCAHAERDFGFSPDAETIECAELGIRFPNPFLFLRTEYPKRQAQARLWYQAINHGDLNLRNVLVDEQENLYVVDFSETRPRNIVSDFARMESIVKFQIVHIETSEDLARMVEFEQGLAEVCSLRETPPNQYRGGNPEVQKAYAAICRLREYANTVTLFETDIIPFWLALLEWTFSVLSYDEPPLRRKLAAYSAAILCGRIRQLSGSAPVRPAKTH
jgi:anti-anti-sigma factor